MINRDRLNKAKTSLREEGVLIFTKKLIRYIPWAISRTYVKYSKFLPKPLKANKGKYDSEYLYLSNPIFQIDDIKIKESKTCVNYKTPIKISSATWFVPYFEHLSYGGIYTIFRFINFFSSKGVRNNIVIYDKPSLNVKELKQKIDYKFPNIKNIKIIVLDRSQSVENLPPTDIAICTFWVSAYLLLRFNQTKRKYYFIQDYEPLFYEGGSVSALAESTYRFGFRGIVNTPGLLRAINQRHGLEGISFIPSVDHDIYYPPKNKNNKKIKIFFYARPNNPRNAFYLGVMIIKELILKYGNSIEIITAGSNWKEKNFELKGMITNLGLIKDLKKVAEIYRSCDIGFVYMLSKHPSYQPFEFMSTGVATVTNNNEDNLWFLKDGYNCLISEPSPKAMIEKISILIEDKKLRKKIQNGGYSSINTTWEEQMDIIWNDIINT